MVVDEYTKDLWKNSRTNLLIGVLILILMRFFRPNNNYETSLLLITIIWVATLITKIKNKEPIKINNWFLTPIIVVAFIISFQILTIIFGNGWLGLIITITIIVIYKLYKRRKEYLEGMRRIETMIWGKNLDKKNWKEK